MEIMDAPEEILIVEILPRLPVKSILKFKAVSKTWNSVISGPKFQNIYSNHSSKPHRPLNVVLYTSNTVEEPQKRWRLHSYKLFGEQLIRWGPETFSNGRIPFASDIKHCEGLLCFIRDQTYRVCNPSTGEMQSVGSVNDIFSADGFGFGYNYTRNEYKLVRRIVFSHDNISMFRFEVITVGVDGTWRSLEQVTDLVPGGKSISLDGKVYWFSGCKLHSFDVQKEEIDEIGVPDVLRCLSPYNVALLVLNDRLSLAYYNCKTQELDIWVLIGANSDSWSCAYCIQTRYCGMYSGVRPVCMWREKILLHYRNRLSFYDCETKFFTEVRGDWRNLQMITSYEESTVPIKKLDAAHI